MQRFKVGNVCVAVIGSDRHKGLHDFAALYKQVDHSGDVDIELRADDSGLTLIWNRQADVGEKQKPQRVHTQEPLCFYLDVAKSVKQYRSFPAPKQGAFNQSLGKKSRRIVDGTGGWGGDALLMCAQGYEVTIIERQPVMALLLSDAMARLAQTDWAIDNRVVVPTVKHADSINTLGQFAEDADCVYLDPMFPPKKKKSAATNKNMRLLHWLVGEDVDATELVAAALLGGASRIAVKRPDYAQPLYCKPSVQFSSKLVHYDVYLASQRT